MVREVQVVADQDREEAPIFGDILEVILAHVPLIGLPVALQVSKSWNQGVYSSLRSLKSPKPWLIIRSQATRSPYATSSYAYDPRSHMWIKISQPSIECISALKSSHSNFLYMLTPSKLSFSFDPLNLAWNHIDAPQVWRKDPVVGKVGDSIVVAGGAYHFEGDPLAVELYDINRREWRKCKSMPENLKDFAASTWLSTAATRKKLYILEKHSSLLYSFDLDSNDWSGPYDLRPDQRCFNSVIGCVDKRLILVGLIGDVGKVEKVGIWEVSCANFVRREIGEMPQVLAEKLKNETFGTFLEICLAESLVYMYNPVEVEEVVVCELMNGGGCRWSNTKNVAACGGVVMERLVFTCIEINVEDLQLSMRLGNRRFVEISVS